MQATEGHCDPHYNLLVSTFVNYKLYYQDRHWLLCASSFLAANQVLGMIENLKTQRPKRKQVSVFLSFWRLHNLIASSVIAC